MRSLCLSLALLVPPMAVAQGPALLPPPPPPLVEPPAAAAPAELKTPLPVATPSKTEQASGTVRLDQHEQEEQERAEARRRNGVLHLERAYSLFGDGKVLEAETELSLAEANGADTKTLRESIDAEKDRQGKVHLARAWSALRAGKVALALQERREASSLGQQDAKLWAELDHLEAVEEQKKARRAKLDAEQEERRRDEEERARTALGAVASARLTAQWKGQQVMGSLKICRGAAETVQYFLDRSTDRTEKASLTKQKGVATKCITLLTALVQEAPVIEADAASVWGSLSMVDDAPAGSDGAKKAVLLRKSALAIAGRARAWEEKVGKATPVAEEATRILQSVGR